MPDFDIDNVSTGTKLEISKNFMKEPDVTIEKYLGTIQVVSRVEKYNAKDAWFYFDGVPQPFHYEEIVRIVEDVECIDDESVEYQHGDVSLIFGEV